MLLQHTKNVALILMITIVVGKDGTIGNQYIVEGRFWAGEHTWVITFHETVNLEYVKFFLEAWDYKYLITGGVIPGLAQKGLESISLPIPPFEVQKRIADEARRRRSEVAKLRQEVDAIVEKQRKRELSACCCNNFVLG